MEKMTINQVLAFTNVYVPVYIEDEFNRYDCKSGSPKTYIRDKLLSDEQLNCPIDYIRNVDGGHFGDSSKNSHGIVLGIGIENWEKFFGKN